MVPREARRFQGDRAGFVTRFVAAGIDYAIVTGVLLLLYLGVAVVAFAFNPLSFNVPRAPFLVFLGIWTVIAWTYFATAWATTGRTFGSRVMGIRVVGHRGSIMRPAGAGLRAAFCLAFMPGLFWVIVSNENRSLQDTVLRSSVIYDWTKRAPERETDER
jgi:uncharacterized RDD family membrane protein YckC